MTNTTADLNRAIALMERARDLQEQAQDATLDCLTYIETHTSKFLRQYGTDLNYHMTLLEAIEDYIKGDEYVLENTTILIDDIKDAMEVNDDDH